MHCRSHSARFGFHVATSRIQFLVDGVYFHYFSKFVVWRRVEPRFRRKVSFR
jgi:hypothetical protein